MSERSVPYHMSSKVSRPMTVLALTSDRRIGSPTPPAIRATDFATVSPDSSAHFVDIANPSNIMLSMLTSATATVLTSPPDDSHAAIAVAAIDAVDEGCAGAERIPSTDIRSTQMFFD